VEAAQKNRDYWMNFMLAARTQRRKWVTAIKAGSTP
jgi:hypothetical protein